MNTLAEAYLEERKDSNGETGWATKEFLQSIGSNVARGLALIMLVLDNAESDEIVEGIAAGALKSLLTIHGHDAFNRC